MTLLFQIDSDHKNCNMVWGELGMLYFCISNEDLKNQRFENTSLRITNMLMKKVVLLKEQPFM